MLRRLLQSLLLAAVLGSPLAAGACARPPATSASASQAVQVNRQPAPARPTTALDLRLPNEDDTVKFGVIGDMGTGGREQYEVAAQMARWHGVLPFEFVIMLGDNLYGGQDPADFVTKFEKPYKPLLDADVKFYAALGNHDNQENRFYEPWNMKGERFYSFEKGHVRFFVLDTDYLDQKQRQWIERELASSNDDWKIVYFHHPLYSSADTHGSEVDLQLVLEPLFVKHGVNVVFQGHDHVYERLKPQKGIHYFVEGSSGKLRPGDLNDRSPLTEVGNDQDNTFMLVEIDDDNMHFQTITRTGKTVDAGTLPQQEKPRPAPVGTTGVKP
jgi:predicted phosphodiesterase